MPMLSMHNRFYLVLPLALGIGGAFAQAQQTGEPAGQRFGLGSTPPEALARAWDIDVSPDGENLPAGSGSVAAGKQIYEQQCIACHGPTGQEGPMDRLAGGQGSLNTPKPVKTVGSYWPYATTLFDYIHRAMPFIAPQSLSADEVYAVTAYVLNLNGIVPDDAVLDKESLAAIRMPNRDGFKQTDTLTTTKAEACMTDCELLAVSASGTTPSTITEEQVQ